MSVVINRTNKQILYSANTPDYSETDWIINPDLSLLSSVPQKYWKISGDSVLEMTTQEKSNVDAATAANTFPDYVEASTLNVSSTSSTSYITKLTFNANLQANIEYELFWNFTWSYSATTSTFKCRLTHFKDELNTLWQVSVTPTATSDIIPFSNVKTFSVLTSGIYIINLDYAAGSSSKTATINETNITLRRI